MGKEFAAAIWLLAIAIPKSSSNPITSPVDFISGPRSKSLSGNLLKGNTASLTANFLLVLYFNLYLESFSPAIILDAILASGTPFALDTNGTVLLALGFTSITKISSFLIANWIFKRPLTFRAKASFLVWILISFKSLSLMETGGKQHAESPEWTPASSMCCIIPATYTSFPSDIASTSTSIAWSINLSIRIGFCSEALKASLINFLSWLLSCTISIARPPKTYEGLTTTGSPIFSLILIAWSNLWAIPLSACFKFNLINKSLNWSLSSARSIDEYWVPSIGNLFSCKNFANLIGVWPPNWAITPIRFPFDFSLRIIFWTYSSTNGSKYSLSLVS